MCVCVCVCWCVLCVDELEEDDIFVALLAILAMCSLCLFKCAIILSLDLSFFYKERNISNGEYNLLK